MKPLAGATAASQPSKTAKANSSSLRNSTAILSNTSNAIKPRRSTVKGIPASLLRPTSASLAKQREKAVVSSEEMNLASSQDFVNPSSGYPSTEQLHSLNSDDEREEYYSQEQDNRKQDQYPPTAHQLSLYNILCPDIEESEIQKPSRCTNYSHYITQSFKFSNGAIKHELLCRTVNKIVNSYKILTTKFYKNEKILDADVEAFIDFKNSAASYPPDKFTATHETTSALTTEYVSQFLQSWILSRKEGSLEPVFQAFIVTSAQMSKSYVAIAISTSVIDEVSSIMITNEIFSLYFEALQRDSILTAHRVIDSYTSKEQNDDFTDFAYKISAASRNATNVWKDVCIETVQENIEGPERVDIENQRKHLMVECDSLRAQVSNLTIRKAELEIELSTLRYQRRQMDVDNVGPMEVYLDPVTNQVTEVSKAAKAAISRLVLGDDAVGDNVGALLSKHDCSDDILYKMKNMRLDEFSRISEDDLVLMGLMAKDRRKVMALSEYVRNRVKESMQEQTKIKFALERKILKQQREYDMVASNLKAAQNSLDISDDMAIRLGNVLNPPAFDVKIHALGLEKNRARPTWPSDYHEVWGFLPFEIDELVVKTLRAFKESCKNSERQKKKTRSRSAPDHDSDNYATSSEDEHDPFSDIKPQNSKACCLAAFAVMLKHVAGCEKFLIGCVESFRKNGVLVGPLTDIVPVKFDFTGNETTFNSVLNAVKKSLWNVNRLVSESPFIDTAKKLEVDSVFPIQFQYFPEKETLSWRHAGMTTRDLLSMKVFSAHESKPEHNIVDIERQWVINELSRDCEFKLTLVEDADEIVGAIQYRKDLYDDDKVQKWVAKFQ
ncbi:hypothetical protein BC830DRAFT_1216247 [Chytriomyces sp. MP71]|nr:hypothetical protein BC830DRAFT_1216247 [Chytriomyces sp. MP71]